MKIHVLFEHGSDQRPHGCSYIRLLLPLAHPVNAGRIQWTSGTTYEGGADVVIVERMWQPDTVTTDAVETLIARIRKERARLLYTLDDDLLDLRPWSALYTPLSATQRSVVRLLAREADGVIVSTDSLRERMLRLNPRVAVLPNQVDETLFRLAQPLPVRDGGEPLTIGFMGTFSHEGDLMMILEALRSVLRRRAQRVRLQLVGAVGDAALLGAFEGLHVEVLNENRPIEYPRFVDWMASSLRWDLALAPLEDTPFTRCKSDLKFLDYSALGIPGIYSRVPSYAATVRHLETGWLADSSPDAWREALERMLDDASLRHAMAQRARECVRDERTLAHNAERWPQVIRNLALPPGGSNEGPP